MLKLPKRGGNGASQGKGRGERREIFFSPPPPPSPFFALTPTLRVTIIFLLSPIFLCHKIKDGGFIVAIRAWTTLRPPKISLHCRLHKCPTTTLALNFISVNFCKFSCAWARPRRANGSLYVYGKLPTYPSLKPTSALTSHLGQNVGLGEG